MDSTRVLQVAFVAIATYGVHSTLLLSIVWLSDRRCGSQALREKLWKWAAVGPLVTTGLQISLVNAMPGWEIPFGSAATEADQVERKIGPGTTQTGTATAKFAASLDRQQLAADTGPQIGKDPAARTPRGSYPESTGRNEVQSEPTAAIVIPKPAARSSSSDFSKKVATQADSDWSIEITPAPPTEDLPSIAGPETPPVAVVETHHPAQRRMTTEDSAKPQRDNVARTVTLRKAKAVTGSDVSQHEAEQAAGSPLLYLVLLVASGSVVGCGRLFVLAVKTARHLATCESVTHGRMHSALREICDKRSVRRRVHLLMSSRVAEPSACGVFRWTIVLPLRLDERLTVDELSALFSHEVGHLVRRDTVWLWIGRALSHCLPWQPLNFVAVKRWQQASEFQCDDWAVRDPKTRIVLARVLTRVAAWKSAGEVCPGVSVVSPPLSQRVERLLSDTPPVDRWLSHRRRFVLTVALFATIGCVSMFAPRLVWAKADVRKVQRKSALDSQAAVGTDVQHRQMEQLNRELDLLAEDLEVALLLLSEQEQTTEVTEKAHAIREGIKRVRSKLK